MRQNLEAGLLLSGERVVFFAVRQSGLLVGAIFRVRVLGNNH
jgi:hypothetical protein